jgi:D-alanyl-D-alanine carboxypeptidase
VTPVAADTAADWRAKAQAAVDTHDGLNGLWVAYSDPEKGYWSAAVGNAATSPTTPATIDDYGRIGSITKTFTATAVLEQVAAGKLALDDRVATVIPDTAARFPAVAGRTVRELLNMSSGLPDYGNSPGTVVAETIKDPTRVWTPQQLIGNALQSPALPRGTPGYNTTNYVLLGLILERVTGQPVDQVVNAVARQAGLTHTVLPPANDTALPAPASHGYIDAAFVEDPAVAGTGLAAGTDVTGWSESWGGAGGAMYSTVEDIFRWAATGMGTAFLPADLAAQRLDTNIPALADKGYGLGIEQPAVGWIGHGGQTLGWTAFAAYNPQTGATFAAIANSPTGIAVAQLLWLNISQPEPQTLLQLTGGTVPRLG